MRKVEREYVKLCQAEGFDLIGIERSHRHLKLRFEVGTVLCAGTPSDCRNRLNVRAQIRRLHS
ncbi:MAG: hypothetical protein HLUCCA05_12765 [Roseibaca calidilacus]|uniref:Uncharacterized protein n=1 Tax=Roseibaca calidilacus TaxID=1666912 RepID=A0A0P7WTG2_9RHOB|nr:MAG: hypothetical protein HLUCCA05_12765 [Roseibaca calidilacus]CUX81410.1 hypothetical protein Ga0058931_1747 [Roseibaca calidilacus]